MILGLNKKEEIVLIKWFHESSDYVRFSQGLIRQSGKVNDISLKVSVIVSNRMAHFTTSLSGIIDTDFERVKKGIEQIRRDLVYMPEDLHIMFAKDMKSTQRQILDRSLDNYAVCSDILKQTANFDLVGIYVGGSISRGFANSLGQLNWFETESFHFDYSLYHHKDKAVKNQYAGKLWDSQKFGLQIEQDKIQFNKLSKTPVSLKPGKYRVFLSSQALSEIIDLLSWGGFSGKSHKTHTSPFMKLIDGNKALSSKVNMYQSYESGYTENFDAYGFVYSGKVTLIENGRYKESLISARTAKEYNLSPNSSDSESPSTFEMSCGTILDSEILSTIDNGLYISQLWYLNYSDITACRMTGMTRFACFLVEDGSLIAPLNVMRFDVSIYDIFGSDLLDFTKRQDLVMSASSYGGRSTNSKLLPGAIIKSFNLTL